MLQWTAVSVSETYIQALSLKIYLEVAWMDYKNCASSAISNIAKLLSNFRFLLASYTHLVVMQLLTGANLIGLEWTGNILSCIFLNSTVVKQIICIANQLSFSLNYLFICFELFVFLYYVFLSTIQMLIPCDIYNHTYIHILLKLCGYNFFNHIKAYIFYPLIKVAWIFIILRLFLSLTRL